MCESINELAHLRINEFLYPYLAFRNANTIEVDIAWGLRWFFSPSANTLFKFHFSSPPQRHLLFSLMNIHKVITLPQILLNVGHTFLIVG